MAYGRTKGLFDEPAGDGSGERRCGCTGWIRGADGWSYGDGPGPCGPWGGYGCRRWLGAEGKLYRFGSCGPSPWPPCPWPGPYDQLPEDEPPGGVTTFSSSDCAGHPSLWDRVPKPYGHGTRIRTVCLLVEKAALELRPKVRSQDRARTVHQKRHLVPNETDVRLGVCKYRE